MIFPLAEHFFGWHNIDSMKLLGTNEAAKRLGVSTRRVRALIAEGKLQATYVGGGYVIEESALDAVRVYGKAGRPPKAKAETVSKASKKK
jgi:excisionase family DNA binding protein